MMSSLESSTEHWQQPILVVVMGISGTGKSTLASEIASLSGAIFLDADSLHTEDARLQMSQGIPLTEAQRSPWIKRIYGQLCQYQSQNKSCVLAYSGLKQQHRKVIFSAYIKRAGIVLNAEQSLIAERLAKRAEHFMPPQLLSSQIAEMEPFDDEVSLLNLDVTNSVQALLLQAVHFIELLDTE